MGSTGARDRLSPWRVLLRKLAGGVFPPFLCLLGPLLECAEMDIGDKLAEKWDVRCTDPLWV